MNQILITKSYLLKRKFYKTFFKIELVLSMAIFVSCLIYTPYLLNSSKSQERTSKLLLNTYNISKLYSSINTIESLNNNISPHIIGIISIDKIHISYPIMSNVSDELLNTSICRFFGPDANKPGNLCMAGHNYGNGSFFSHINKLNIGDKISIVDNNNFEINYYVYEKYETSANDFSCTSQDTFNIKEITLVTCNNINGNRIIIKAKER